MAHASDGWLKAQIEAVVASTLDRTRHDGMFHLEIRMHPRGTGSAAGDGVNASGAVLLLTRGGQEHLLAATEAG